MANVTDPLARAVHGTNPQNLIEYITRQKIYDSLYWKEECFGLSASEVATKAAELKTIGGTFGGNNKPTRFLCLALKLLQIQPEEGIVEEFIQNEDFKYVRALGAFYLRLTGRPAEIFELIEPLYNDFRKVRFRESTGWRITYMDELAHELLTSERYCGIALPHLPKREVLVNSGYLDGERRSALMPLIEEKAGGDAELFLEKLAENGNEVAKTALEERRKRKREIMEKEQKLQEQIREDARERERDSRHNRDRYGREGSRRYDDRDRYDDNRRGDDYDRGYDRHGDERDYTDERDRDYRDNDDRHNRDHKDKKSEKKYGSLFKSNHQGKPKSSRDEPRGVKEQTEEENTEDYWNDQRAKLGLKPLEK
ncbi:hypothetical protein ACHAXN_003706 [Cyclotella atomus]